MKGGTGLPGEQRSPGRGLGSLTVPQECLEVGCRNGAGTWKALIVHRAWGLSLGVQLRDQYEGWLPAPNLPSCRSSPP